MRVLRIQPCGDLVIEDTIVGKIKHDNPLLSWCFAGEYFPYPEDQEWSGCPLCAAATEETHDLQAEIKAANHKIEALGQQVQRLGRKANQAKNNA